MKIARLYLNVSMLIALCLFAPPLFAQKASLSISPPRLELIAQPGKSLLIAYQLINNGDPGVFQTKVLPFSPRNELGQITIKPEMEGPIRFSLDNSEVQLDTPFFLKGEGSQQLLLRIRVPDGAPQGDYYYTLLAESQPSPGQEGVTAPQAKITIGTPILVTVTQTGELDLRGSIGIFDTLAPITLRLFGKTVRIFDSSDTVPVTLQINNQGKNLFTPTGQIILKGNFGEKATYDIVPDAILKESNRVARATPSAEINCDTSASSRLCQSNVSLLVSGFFIGKYDLQAKVQFSENGTPIIGTTYFIALPIKLGGMVLVLLLIGGGMLWKRSKVVETKGDITSQ